jgi:hypothetical protein
MRDVLLTLLILQFLALACSTELTECDGILVGNQCHECPGNMVDGECVTRGNMCTVDEACLPVGVCLDGFCGQECTKNEDCPGILKCELYRCIVAGGGPDVVTKDTAGMVACNKHVDCDPYDMACIDGFCDQECTKDWQCEGSGAKCVGYMCTTNVGPDVIQEDAVPGDITEPPDTTLPPDCDPTDGPYGAACHCKQECATALCIENKILNSAICTQYCQNDAQCPGPDVCVAVGDTSVCILNDSGQDTSCDPDLAFCYKGFFLTNKLGNCACTTPCNKADECPEGFGCHVLGADKVCVSTGEVCSATYNPCFGECAGFSEPGFCTNLCILSTDCPNGWTCQPIGQGLSVCASPF